MQKLTRRRIILTLLTILALACYFFLLFWFTSLYIESFTSLSPLSRSINAYFFEPLAIAITFLVILIITNRIWISLLTMSGLYILFMLINAEMVEILGLIFSPIDFKHSFQVFLAKEFLLGYWKSLLILLLLVIGFIFLFFKTNPNKHLKKYQLPAFIVLIPALIILSINSYSASLYFKNNFILKGQSVPQIFSEYNGFLFSFYYQILKNRPVTSPDKYSEEKIKNIVSKYQLKDDKYYKETKPHVIIFLIEAFADPKQSGVETSYDPIPNFRKYAKESISGMVMSPELGGRSANPEFELLTGLSMRFVPEKSIPYIDFINKPYPSLAREFNRNGYKTSALHVADLAFFNYKKAYDFLGFDYIDTLYGRNDVEMDPINRFPSENALVDEITKITDNSTQPQFIFSFPNSTHGVWDYDTYLNSDLDVTGEFLFEGKSHLKTYINAIHQADKAIGKLIKHYEYNNIPAVILVLGDHQPGLPEFREKSAINFLTKHFPEISFKNRRQLRRAIRHKALTKDYNFYKQNHKVPYLIWNNVNSSNKKIDTSMNLLSPLLLNKSGIKYSSLYELLSQLQEKVGSFSKMTPLPKGQKTIIQDYRLIQYDIMSGKNYYMKIP